MRLGLLGIGAVPVCVCLQHWLEKPTFGRVACERAADGILEGSELRLVQVVFRWASSTSLT